MGDEGDAKGAEADTEANRKKKVAQSHPEPHAPQGTARDERLINLLCREKIIHIILHLLDHPEGSILMDFRRSYSIRVSNIAITVNKLFNEGLIEYIGKPSRPRMVLTDRGQAMAQKLSEAVQVQATQKSSKKQKKSATKSAAKTAAKKSPLQSDQIPEQAPAKYNGENTPVTLKVILQEPIIARIVLHLLDNPEGVKRQVFHNPPISIQIDRARRYINRLFKTGVVTMAGPPTNTVLVLTKSGMEMATALKKLYGELEGEGTEKSEGSKSTTSNESSERTDNNESN